MKENIKLKNMKGQLEIMKTLGIKPNFSELERAFGLERHTIKKYYDGDERKQENRNKSSKLDKYYEEIKTKINLVGATQMGVYQYIFNKDNTIGTYSNFKKYLTKHNLKPNKSEKVHLRYETDPGEQLQFDWKEDIKMISKHGEIFEFNVFSATLGYSRLHDFVYSKTKTREDIERCLMTTFKYINGVPKQLLTDNILYIYHNKQIIATHEINLKLINYAKEHYIEGLQIIMPYKDKEDIEKYANDNLKRLDSLLLVKIIFPFLVVWVLTFIQIVKIRFQRAFLYRS